MLTFSVNKKTERIFVQHMCEFKRAFDNENTTKARKWASEFYFKALDGKVDVYVNLDAYGYECEKNARMAEYKNETPIIDEQEYKEGKSGIYQNYISVSDNGIDAFLNMEECKDAVEQFVEIHDYLIVEEGVSLWRIVELSLQYNRRAMNKLKGLSIKYNMIEMIRIIISNRYCLVELKKRMA